jgi:hypothetical protein
MLIKIFPTPMQDIEKGRDEPGKKNGIISPASSARGHRSREKCRTGICTEAMTKLVRRERSSKTKEDELKKRRRSRSFLDFTIRVDLLKHSVELLGG